jgi:hypothetical protein
MLVAIVAIWCGLNLAIFAFILWQRSPHFRHRVWRLTLGALRPGAPTFQEQDERLGERFERG